MILFSILFILSTFNASAEVFLNEELTEELIPIQAVTKSRRVFSVRKGLIDGISIGQESLFTTNNSSFRALAKVVNRHFSMWEIKGTKGGVTFEKGDYVHFTNNINTVFVEIPKYLLRPKKQLVFTSQNVWTFKGTFSYSLSESVSETETDRIVQRNGLQIEASYGRKLNPSWEWSLGLRIDKENQTLEDPNIDIPTTRTLVIGDITYHFEKLKQSLNNLYFGVGLGYGRSSTNVDEAVSTGPALVLPAIKLGYINRISPKYSLLVEGTFESISSTESFTDTEPQSTNILNSKLTVGVRF